MHILHLEDSVNDAELIENIIHQGWPDCVFERGNNRIGYETALRTGGFDLVLSDYSIPDFDGLSALELARAWCPDKPFIFLSGTIGEERAVEALRRGAVDYVMKDRPSRLLPAIQQALVRCADAARHRAAEARIREQASLLDKARDAICVTNLDRRITFWNASAARLFGWSASEALGRDVCTLVFSGETARFEEAFARLLATGEWSGDLKGQTRSESTLIVESRWTLVDQSKDRPSSVLFINTDITERKKLEAQLMRAQRLESVSTLTGGIAHDLNNVLSPIVMAADVLSLQELGPENGELLTAIEASARHGAALVRQLLTFAQGAEGQRSPVDLRFAMADVESLLRPTLGRKVDLSIAFDGEPHPIVADLTQLHQAIINLCVNARDAMPDGGSIKIRVSNVRLDENPVLERQGVKPGMFVQIAVTDTGTGIPPEIADQIFDPFFTTKSPGKGTGLGLATVHGIIKGHGGIVQAESSVGTGTTFSLHFPALMEPASLSGAPQPAQ